MSTMELSLPSDVNQLHKLVAELHKENHNYEIELRLLRERIKQLTHQLYAFQRDEAIFWRTRDYFAEKRSQ